MSHRTPEWFGYALARFEFERFAAHALVLDAGCGLGAQLLQLRIRKCRAVGIDLDRASITACREQGLPIVMASTERMPFRAQSFEGVICKVVIPYTDEARALSEIGRLLMPGGTARLCCHGAGYYLRYLLCGISDWRLRIYGLRSLINTWVYALAGQTPPGVCWRHPLPVPAPPRELLPRLSVCA